MTYILFYLVFFAILLAICSFAVVASKQLKGTVSTSRQAHKGSFDEKGRFVREASSKTKIGHIVVDTDKSRTFFRNNERDSIQDPPLSEAERNVILGK